MPRLTRCVILLTLTLLSARDARAQGSNDILTQSKFGAAVAVSDGDVLVGEPENRSFSGRVYVFRNDDRTAEWMLAQTVEPENGMAMNGFGAGVATSGELAVAVATDGEDAGAYVFRRSDDGLWVDEAVLQPQVMASDSVGAGLAVSDDRIFLTVFGADETFRIVEFKLSVSDGAWSQVAETVDIPAEEAADITRPVAASDSLLFVGAPSETGGAVFILKRDRDDWAFDQIVEGEPTEGEGQSLFGSALVTDGRVLLVGAPRDEDGQGVVYVFSADDAGTFERKRKLSAFGDGSSAGFGTTIAIDSQVLLVGAFDSDSRDGTVYLFERDGSDSFEPVRVFEGPEKGSRADFGTALALREGVAVIGARTDLLGYGSTYIHQRLDDGHWSPASRVRAPLGYRPESITGGKIKCADGDAAGFDCRGIDVVSFLSNEDLGSEPGIHTNDVWGWTDPESDKEYAIVGAADGTIFIDISDPERPIVLGKMHMTPGSRPNWWRDAKTYKNHVYVVADNVGDHGVQVFDLTRLRTVENPPVEFEPTAHYDGFDSAHNIIINEETGFAYVVGINGGGETCGGGSHILDLSEPADPKFVGCFAHEETGDEQSGYTHDAQCVVYHGPDERYTGKEICIAANETAISIADLTDKQNPVEISIGRYPNFSYVHQGWLTEDHRYYFQNDEGDELDGLTSGTRTLVWDLAELDDPVLVNEHISTNPAVDHNLYIKGSYMYQSNYLSGLRVFDISNPAEPREVGYLDTVPWGDDGPGFGGSWSNYPFFKSGVIVVSSGEEGVFFLKRSELVP